MFLESNRFLVQTPYRHLQTRNSESLFENGIPDTFDVKCCGFFVGFEPKVASKLDSDITVQEVAV